MDTIPVHLLDDDCPDWLIEGVIQRNSLAVLSGRIGIGKSFLALSLQFHIAAGIPWNGMKIEKGWCLHVCAESGGSIGRRLRALCFDNGVQIDENLPISVGKTIRMTERESVDALISVVLDKSNLKGPPALIVIDTVDVNFGFGDGVSAPDIFQFVDGCNEIRKRTGAAVLLVHHIDPDEIDRVKDSNYLLAACHSSLVLSRVEGNRICLESNKVKDGKPLKPMHFHLHKVELDYVDDEGEPVTSCVMRYMPDVESIVQNTLGRGKNQKKAMDILRKQYALQRANVEASGRPASAAHVTAQKWQELCKAEGIDRRRFFEIRNALITSGAVRIDGLHVIFDTDEIGMQSDSQAKSTPEKTNAVQTLSIPVTGTANPSLPPWLLQQADKEPLMTEFEAILFDKLQEKLHSYFRLAFIETLQAMQS